MAGGASFGQGGRGNFHRVFEHGSSPFQGECAVLAQAFTDTPQDVLLQFSCHESGLRVNVPEKVLQGRTTEWSARVDSAWPILAYITICCTSGKRGSAMRTRNTLVSFRTAIIIKNGK